MINEPLLPRRGSAARSSVTLSVVTSPLRLDDRRRLSHWRQNYAGAI